MSEDTESQEPTQIAKPRKWRERYGADMNWQVVDLLLMVEPFRSMVVEKLEDDHARLGKESGNLESEIEQIEGKLRSVLSNLKAAAQQGEVGELEEKLLARGRGLDARQIVELQEKLAAARLELQRNAHDRSLRVRLISKFGNTAPDPDQVAARLDEILASEPPDGPTSGLKGPEKRMREAEDEVLGPLRDIILHETRIKRTHLQDEEGPAIVVRQGDYGSSAFLMLAGEAAVIFGLSEAELGRMKRRPKSWRRTLARLWTNPRYPEVRDIRRVDLRSSVDQAEGTVVYLQDFPVVIQDGKAGKISSGMLFGELAALSRTPRTATVVATRKSCILEIKWQGFRDLMNFNRAFRTNMERNYREYALRSHLQSLEMFREVGEADLERLVSATLFETYGKFEWTSTFRELAELSPIERIAREPVIAEEGHYVNSLILIRSGFARITQRYNNGHRTVDYLGKGSFFGFDEILHNHRNAGDKRPYRYTLRAVGYVDILRIPVPLIEELVLRPDSQRTPPYAISDKVPRSRSLRGAERENVAENSLARNEARLLDFFIDQRFMNGTKTMLINLDRCTRCDDCVRACSDSHDNNPRFIRHGQRDGKFMVANACMHCDDPVCMIGCPTGAIHRRSTGQVVINDDTCIGCETCANSCPYSNIRMVNIRDRKGALILDEHFDPVKKATKCDLCIDQLVSPACESACPHDALRRVDIHNIDRLQDWLEE